MLWKRMTLRWTDKELREWSSAFRILYLLFPLILYYLATDITDVILWALINFSTEGASESTITAIARFGATIQGVVYGLGLVIALIILKNAAVNEITYVTKGEDKPHLSVLNVLELIVSALVFSIGLNYLFNLIGLTESSVSFARAYELMYGVNFVAGLIIYGLLSPVAEEIIFRGILYNRMKRIFPIPLSMIVSSLLFGVFHGNIVQGIYGTLMGMVIVYFYEKYKSFYAPLIIHVVANLGVYVLTYVIWK